ncbi:hypothetical protein M2436_000700 [Streptomyces sp. HB372]|nr:hypothetical protein [Streptomyces sp. HB372]
MATRLRSTRQVLGGNARADGADQPGLQRLAHLHQLQQSRLAPAVPHDRPEGQAFGEGRQRERADEGAEAPSDLHDVHGLQRLEGLAHRDPPGGEQLHQLGFGGQRIARTERPVQDQFLDPPLDVLRHGGAGHNRPPEVSSAASAS